MPEVKWRVIIADDEPAARRGVRQLLAPFTDFLVVGECRNGKEVLAALDPVRPDVVFLDIQMPEIGGFEVIRQRTPERMPAVVFLTAYDQFALRAFEAAAQDYLVKPVSEARFAATMRRLAKRLRGGSAAQQQVLVVPTSRGDVVLGVDEIDWIEAADYYVRVWVGSRGYLLRDSLSDLEARVAGHGYARAHRGALVRLSAVRELKSTGGEVVAVLSSGARVRVSRRRRATFVSAVRSRGL